MVLLFLFDDLFLRVVSYGFLGLVVILFYVKEFFSIIGVLKFELGVLNVLGGNIIYVNIIGN